MNTRIGFFGRWFILTVTLFMVVGFLMKESLMTAVAVMVTLVVLGGGSAALARWIGCPEEIASLAVFLGPALLVVVVGALGAIWLPKDLRGKEV